MQSLDEALLKCSPINTKLDRTIELVVETLEKLEIILVTRFATIETTLAIQSRRLDQIKEDIRAKPGVRSNKDWAYMECNSSWRWVKKGN